MKLKKKVEIGFVSFLCIIFLSLIIIKRVKNDDYYTTIPKKSKSFRQECEEEDARFERNKAWKKEVYELIEQRIVELELTTFESNELSEERTKIVGELFEIKELVRNLSISTNGKTEECENIKEIIEVGFYEIKTLDRLSETFGKPFHTIKSELDNLDKSFNYINISGKIFSPKPFKNFFLDLIEKTEKELEKSDKNIFFSIPNNEELQEGINNSALQKSYLFISISFPRRIINEEQYVDWTEVWKNKVKDNENKKRFKEDKSELKNLVREINEEYIKKYLNPNLEEQTQIFVNKVNNIAEFNQWLNKHLNTIVVNNSLIISINELSLSTLRVNAFYVNNQVFTNEKLSISIMIPNYTSYL